MTANRGVVNKRNASRSTGPRTEAGKLRSRSNALRHGLAAERTLQHYDDPDVRIWTSYLLQDYPDLPVEDLPGGLSYGLAETFTRSVFNVFRTRDVKSVLFDHLVKACTTVGGADIDGLLADLERAARYEQRAFSRRQQLLRQWCVAVERCRYAARKRSHVIRT